MKTNLKKAGAILCATLMCVSMTLAQPTLVQACTGQANNVADDLTANLTSDSWVKVLGTDPDHPADEYIYTFSKDGSYTQQLITDVNVKPVTGQWRLTTDEKGKTHLVLTNEKDKYYWLQQDSVIEYDKTNDMLLLSGKKYVGIQQLHRRKIETPAA